MKEIKIEDKQAYFNENCPYTEIPKLTEQRECLHCKKVITIGDYKVYKHPSGAELIHCPNAPHCDGTLIDWVPIGLFDW